TKPSERCWLCQPRNLWSNSSFRPRSGVRFSFNLHDKFTCSIVQMRIKITLEITLKRNVFHIAIRYDEFVHGITTTFECFDLFVLVSMCFANCLLSYPLCVPGGVICSYLDSRVLGLQNTSVFKGIHRWPRHFRQPFSPGVGKTLRVGCCFARHSQTSNKNHNHASRAHRIVLSSCF